MCVCVCPVPTPTTKHCFTWLEKHLESDTPQFKSFHCRRCHNLHDLTWSSWLGMKKWAERLGLGGSCTLVEKHKQPRNCKFIIYWRMRRRVYYLYLNEDAGQWISAWYQSAVILVEETVADFFCVHYTHLYSHQGKSFLIPSGKSLAIATVWGIGVLDMTVVMSTIHIHWGLPWLHMSRFLNLWVQAT